MTTSKDAPLRLTKADDERDEDALARSAAGGQVGAAASTNILAGRLFGEGRVDLTACLQAVEELGAQVSAGDLTPLEKMLTAQAVVLDQLFGDLTRRALGASHQKGREVDLKLALKAQAQCRSTVEALAEIKQPAPKVFARQANITSGPQQVNNGLPPARTGKSGKQSNELLEDREHEQWLDTRATGKTGRADPAMATLGEIHGRKDGRGKGR
ncbi:hypothetical protein [Crenobacter intestini]|uniref:hypothetical protein n=1 Tax=Crenobacter intestini TaxID=2563443 RepID=UPI0014588273|nr:hypothetical protein [Crenobacter intestini]